MTEKEEFDFEEYEKEMAMDNEGPEQEAEAAPEQPKPEFASVEFKNQMEAYEFLMWYCPRVFQFSAAPSPKGEYCVTVTYQVR